MKPEINLDFKKMAKKLIKIKGLREAAYQCGVADYKLKRIADGITTRIDYDCGVLLKYHHEQEFGK